MSKLAASLSEVEVPKVRGTRHAACYPVYGVGDQEDKDAVDRLREQQVEWVQIHETVDNLLGIADEDRINTRKFIRHWRADCSCWDTPKSGA